MCIVMVCTTHFPTKENLLGAENFNKDGGGMAWIENGKVHYKKGLKAEEMYKIYEERNLQLPIVIHFRIASVGGVKKQLCHPFPITKNAETNLEGITDAVLFHNGHWHDWDDTCLQACISRGLKFPGGDWSDSRAMAWLADKCGVNFLKLIGGFNKIAVLTPKGVQMFGEGWKDSDNMKCSNDSYTRRAYNVGGVETPNEEPAWMEDWENYKKEYKERHKNSNKSADDIFDEFEDAYSLSNDVREDLEQVPLFKINPQTKRYMFVGKKENLP